jgi:hypothetical protein
MSPYTANAVEPIMLFDELMRIGQGDVESYKRVREGAWAWLMKYPMANNVWVGYFEDVGPGMENMNQVIPLELARYVLLHPEKDPEWREHSRKLIDWVKTTPKWPKYVVHGATVTTEQGNGKEFCCNLPNQCCESHTARLAAVEAFYYAKMGDVLSGTARRGACAVHGSMVVHGRIYGWAATIDGCVLGGAGVGAGRGIAFARRNFASNENFLWRGFGGVFDLRFGCERSAAAGFYTGICDGEWKAPAKTRGPDTAGLHAR